MQVTMLYQEGLSDLQSKLNSLKNRISRKKDLAKHCNLEENCSPTSLSECIENTAAEQIFISMISIIFERNSQFLLDKNTMRSNMRTIIAKRLSVNDKLVPDHLREVVIADDYLLMINKFFSHTLRYFKNAEELLEMALAKASKNDSFSSNIPRVS